MTMRSSGQPSIPPPGVIPVSTSPTRFVPAPELLCHIPTLEVASIGGPNACAREFTGFEYVTSASKPLEMLQM